MAVSIGLDFKVHWCPKHLKPFRADWPEGAPKAMILLFQAAANDPRIIAAMPKNADGKGKTESLEAVLREFSPLCCLISDRELRKIYRKVGKTAPK